MAVHQTRLHVKQIRFVCHRFIVPGLEHTSFLSAQWLPIHSFLLHMSHHFQCTLLHWQIGVKGKVKQSRNRPGVSQRVPGVLGSLISWHSAREGGEVVSLTHRPPLTPGMFLVPIFTTGWVDPRAMVRSEGSISLKNPVTPPGIDTGAVRLVAQRLNRYATASPNRNEYQEYFLGCYGGRGVGFTTLPTSWLLVNDQRDAQFFTMYLFLFLTLRVSSTSCSSSGETNCVNTTSGNCHSVSVNFRPAHDTATVSKQSDSYQRLCWHNFSLLMMSMRCSKQVELKIKINT
jgi:hypothetical protein